MVLQEIQSVRAELAKERGTDVEINGTTTATTAATTTTVATVTFADKRELVRRRREEKARKKTVRDCYMHTRTIVCVCANVSIFLCVCVCMDYYFPVQENHSADKHVISNITIIANP